MAPIKVMPTLFLVALIIFSHETILSEGIRVLSSKNNGGGELESYASLFYKFAEASKAAELFSADGRRVLASDDDDDDDEHNEAEAAAAIKSTDEFRPTAPGHSPGAGHSHGPSSVDPNQ